MKRSKNSRRAISTIVGSVFFLVLLTSGLSVSYLVIETQSDMISAQQIIADSEIKKIQEKFYASASTGTSNRLAVYVENEGSNSLEIDSLWIINKTNPTQAAQKHDLNYTDAILAPGYGGDILQNKPLFMNPGIYDIKVVSSLGTIKTADHLNVGGANNLKAKLILNPPDVRSGENATALLYVTNVGNTKILNVTSGPMTVTPLTAILTSSPIIQLKSDLLPAESTIISWKYKLTGAPGTNVTFSTFAQGIDEPSITVLQSNSDTNLVNIRDNLESTQVLSDELFARPDIFMIFPGQFGDDDDLGLWGVNIVNPTSQPIFVNKVFIAAQTPRPTSSDAIFEKDCETKNPPPQTVPPTPNNWTCPDSNILLWKNISTPQRIEPRSVFPFLVKVGPGGIGSTLPDPSAVLIQANVFSTLGQFGKAGYGTSMHSTGDGPIPGVYLSKVPGSTAANDMLGNVTGIRGGTNQTFNAVFADFDNEIQNKILANSRLIINIPKGWNDVSIQSATGFTTSIQSFPDGSSQIIGALQADLTGATGTAKTITFTAEAPPVTETKMYVMYILADGLVGVQSGGPFSLGPLAEVVLQVTP